MDIERALGKTVGVEYTPEQLRETLVEAGFAVSHWGETERGDVGEGMTFGAKIRERAERIVDNHLKEKLLKEMEEIESLGRKYGMREFPRYVIYARNPAEGPLKVMKPLPPKELYRTVHRRDLLF